MPFKQWIYRKFCSGRDEYERLSSQLADLNDRLKKLEGDPASQVPLVIHHADKVVIEKVDFSNHFGTLGIETLAGRLNIGFNAFGPLKPDEPCAASPNKPGEQPPKCNIRARKPTP